MPGKRRGSAGVFWGRSGEPLLDAEESDALGGAGTVGGHHLVLPRVLKFALSDVHSRVAVIVFGDLEKGRQIIE